MATALDIDSLFLLTTRSFRSRLLWNVSEFYVSSTHTEHEYTPYYGVFWLTNTYAVFFRNLGIVGHHEGKIPMNYYDNPDILPREDLDIPVILEFPLIVYKVFAPLTLYVYKYDIMDFADFLLKTKETPSFFHDDWAIRRRMEDMTLRCVGDIIEHLKSKDDLWLQFNAGNNPNNPTIPNLSAYCVFIFFYKLNDLQFMDKLYNIVYNLKPDFKTHHPVLIESIARENNESVTDRKFIELIMGHLFKIIDNVFHEMNSLAPTREHPERVRITKRQIDELFERQILNQVNEFKKESETYSLKGLIKGLHVHGRQTGIPRSVTNLRGPVSQFLAEENTLNNAVSLRNSLRTRSGGKRKTRKLRKNRKRKIQLKK